MSSDNPFMKKSTGPAPGAQPTPPGPGGHSGAPSGVMPRANVGTSRRLSVLPTAVAIALILVSIGLAFVVLRGVNSDAVLPLAIAGYICTPFLTAACLIWARALDLRDQGDATYLRADGQRRLKLLGILVLLSFLPALAFIWYIASYVGSVIS